MKNGENFQLLYDLADKLNAAGMYVTIRGIIGLAREGRGGRAVDADCDTHHTPSIIIIASYNSSKLPSIIAFYNSCMYISGSGVSTDRLEPLYVASYHWHLINFNGQQITPEQMRTPTSLFLK